MHYSLHGKLEKKLREVVPTKYHAKAYLLCIIVSLSNLYFGFSLVIIPATTTTLLMDYYDISLSPTNAVALMNGIFPLGAIVGVNLVKTVFSLTTKKYFYLT